MSRPPSHAIVFRYHDHFEVVRNRIAILRQLNPGTPIHGMYGGPGEAPESIAPLFDTSYSLSSPSSDWKWKFSDLAVLEWYRRVGEGLEFSSLFVVEWDLLLLEPLERVFPAADGQTVLLSGHVPLEQVADTWSWMLVEPYKSEWEELKSFVAERHGYQGPFFACVGPAPVLTRPYLDYYASIELPEICHDELRLPLVAQLGGFRTRSTGYYACWDRDDPERQTFNCNRWEVPATRVSERYERGVRVFHPVYEPVQLGDLGS